MAAALKGIAVLSAKLLSGEKMGPAREEGYIHRGIRKNFIHEKSGAERAVEMLLKKLKGEEFRTEYEMPKFNKIDGLCISTTRLYPGPIQLHPGRDF